MRASQPPSSDSDTDLHVRPHHEASSANNDATTPQETLEQLAVDTMLLLDYQNVLIQSVLTERFSGAPAAHIDQTISDFDGVIYHISTPETKTKIQLSIQIRCYKDLVKYGAEQVLQREYGQYVVPPEPGYDFSVMIDLENLPEDKDEREALIMKMALLKRNAMAAPFEAAYEEHYKLKEEASKYTSEEAPQGVREGGEVMAIHYREEEAIYVKASHDRVTVIFSTIFREETDRVFGKIFIQEFVDARRRAIQNAPQVLFRNDPPLELQGVPGVRDTGTGEIGYVTFVLFPRHLTPQRMPDVISHIQTFRDYFHYHIKASKAYIHSRMRKRTADFLQGEKRQLFCQLMPSTDKLQFFVARVRTVRRRSAKRQVAGPSRFRERDLAGAIFVACRSICITQLVVAALVEQQPGNKGQGGEVSEQYK
ncbi:Arp2/3 complex [Colletotrichum graminicola]|nr:Arp2/3 complex [Colletotrichum graminicola]